MQTYALYSAEGGKTKKTKRAEKPVTLLARYSLIIDEWNLSQIKITQSSTVHNIKIPLNLAQKKYPLFFFEQAFYSLIFTDKPHEAAADREILVCKLFLHFYGLAMCYEK